MVIKDGIAPNFYETTEEMLLVTRSDSSQQH